MQMRRMECFYFPFSIVLMDDIIVVELGHAMVFSWASRSFVIQEWDSL